MGVRSGWPKGVCMYIIVAVEEGREVITGRKEIIIKSVRVRVRLRLLLLLLPLLRERERERLSIQIRRGHDMIGY